MLQINCPEGYVEITDIKVMQKLLLQLMVKFHEICEKHHLIYNMCGGTLLGAVRHKGFIPWDDDLDVCMPRKDYEKFIEIAKKEYADEFIILAPGDKNYIYPFVKFCMQDTVLLETVLREKYQKIALYLDVFPVDGYPNLSEREEKLHINNIQQVMSQWGRCIFPISASPVWWKKPYVIIKYLRSFFWDRYGKYVKQFLALTQQYKFEDCDRVSPFWGYLGHEWIEKNIFLDRSLYDFEGYKFWSVRDFDDWLKRMYGDYMTLPPSEKQVQEHGYELYVKKIAG